MADFNLPSILETWVSYQRDVLHDDNPPLWMQLTFMAGAHAAMCLDDGLLLRLNDGRLSPQAVNEKMKTLRNQCLVDMDKVANEEKNRLEAAERNRARRKRRSGGLAFR